MDSAASPSTDARLDEAAHALGLLDLPGFGPRKVLETIARHGGATSALAALRGSSDVTAKLRDALFLVDPAAVRRELEDVIAGGDSFKLWSDSSYPANLSKWSARPPVLFYRGDLDKLSTRALALVGRVDPTAEGIAAATAFGRLCVDNGIDVVSGLAKGIDGASHRAALQAPPGNTYAVVGHGLDHAYPAENRDLYGAIPEHGAVISQFRTGTGPQRWTFPARNEVMCTLALGTVIVEGKTGCGSIIQADFSFKHGRPVFILSRNLRGADNEWAHALVDRGAHVIERFSQVGPILEAAWGDLWGEKEVQAPLFDVHADGSMGHTAQVNAASQTAAIFDLDGVIVDSRSAHTAALAEIATTALGRPVDPSEVTATGSAPKALQQLGVRNSYDVYRNFYDAAFVRHQGSIVVFEEAVHALAELRARGVRVGAVTNQPKRRADLMLPPSVRQLFDQFLTWNDTRGSKEVGIEKCLRAFGVAPSAAVMIGDQWGDLSAARTARVQSLAVLWGFSSEDELASWSPDSYASEPGELEGAVLQLLALPSR